jgi:two-component system sensor histidine kinase UhpB
VNAAAVDLFGANGPGQLLGRSLCESLDAESQASVREHLSGWRAGRTALRLDAKIVRPDGTLLDINVTGAEFGDWGLETGDWKNAAPSPHSPGPSPQSPAPSPQAVLLIVRDVTEQKNAERTLRESEERLALAVAGAQDGVWDWNLETDAVVYSTRWKQMLGYSDDEIGPSVSAWERLVHPDDRPLADRANESVARGERATYEAEFRLRHKDGHYVHVLSRGFPIRREPGGPVVRIVGTHFDLTERKRADAERSRTELLTRLVFAQEDERRRIAREMHDQFGEQQTALALRIQMLKDACGDHDGLRAHLDSIEAIAQRIDRDVDHLVWELRPTALDDLGLRAALANYVQEWSSRIGVSATLHTSGLLDDRLPSDAETTLYRIAQEALTNVAKHARAENVDIILERRADNVMLIIEDDGVGFDPAAAGSAGQGFGLLGMQERAGLVGAMLEIESSAGKGTTVLVRMAAGAGAGGAPDHG